MNHKTRRLERSRWFTGFWESQEGNWVASVSKKRCLGAACQGQAWSSKVSGPGATLFCLCSQRWPDGAEANKKAFFCESFGTP